MVSGFCVPFRANSDFEIIYISTDVTIPRPGNPSCCDILRVFLGNSFNLACKMLRRKIKFSSDQVSFWQLCIYIHIKVNFN